MGNFHCIQEGCAEVRYQRYERANGIRYKYLGEDWVTVDGDNYELIEFPQVCRSYRYREHGVVTYRRTYSDGSASYGTLYFRPDWGSRFVSATFSGNTITVNFDSDSQSTDLVEGRFNNIPVPIESITSYGRMWREIRNENDEIIEESWASASEFDRLHNQTICSGGGCGLSIYKDGERVHYRTSSSCPEIYTSCQLSDRTEVIQIEKIPFLERVEIRDQSIDPIYVSPLEAPLLDVNPLPDECLNIYKTYVAAPPILSNYVPLPGFLNPYEFVAQICSDSGCPPPEYEVICNCEGEECPPGTCPVECGGIVCCYDTNSGQSLAEIPLENYTGGV